MLVSSSNLSLTTKEDSSRLSGAFPNLTFDLVTDLAGMRALETAWRALEARVEERFTYFQTYDWCESWFAVFGAKDEASDGPQLRIFTVTDRGETVAIWPLMVEQGLMGVNTLTWLTSPHGQYGNVLVEAGERGEAALAACWGHIKRLPRIDTIELQDVPATSAIAAILFTEEERADSSNLSSIMDLTRFETVEDYVAALSKTTRRGRGKRYRKLEAHGELSFQVHEGGTDTYQNAVADALRMKNVWLANTGKISRALSMPGNAIFLSSLPVSPGGTGRALATVLNVSSIPVAIELGFERSGDYIGYLGAFDWEMRGYSPGKVQMDLTLRWAIENKIKSYDLLGNAASYKDDWSNIEVPLLSYVSAQSVLGAARAELWVKRLRPALKNTLEGLPDSKRRALTSALGPKPNGATSLK